MLTLKVQTHDAEKVRREVMKNNFYDDKYMVLKEDGFLFLPVKSVFQSDCEFVEKDLKEVKQIKTFKEELKDKLTQKELNSLKTAYDSLGDIAIIEIDEELEPKEKIVGEALIKTNKTIKTVLKKSGIHGGEFRTQDMVYLAGEKTKEAIHKENNVKLKLNVEEVYFSPRLSTERKRLLSKVKKGEDVLVMFSGCAPYPCTISKNTEANMVVGIEKNPEGHKYALKNVKENKLTNVFLINGDVRDETINTRSIGIGLKSRWTKEQLEPKLLLNPHMIEFYMPPGDLEDDDNFSKIQSTIEYLYSRNIKVMIHMPHYYNGSDISLSTKKEKEFNDALECAKRLDNLTKRNKNVMGFIMHSSQFDECLSDYNEDKLIEHLKKMKDMDLLENLFLENSHLKEFGEIKSVLKVINETGLKNMCFDFAHHLGSNNSISKNEIIKLQEKINVYYHVVNFKKEAGTHCERLSEGDIDFKEFADIIKLGVVEVYSKDEMYAKEQIEDYNTFLSYKSQKKFDRILMPLPKSAEDFLDSALLASKPGTIIHFYDFLNENEFDLAKEKIDVACKRNNLNYEINELVKCGQHAPHVFRICVDFKIL